MACLEGCHTALYCAATRKQLGTQRALGITSVHAHLLASLCLLYSLKQLRPLPAVHFEVLYNGDRIIEINVSTDPTQTVDISPDVASKTDGWVGSITFA